MEITDLDGNTQKWSLAGHIAKGQIERKSNLHLQARALIKECFPTMQILEEVGIPVRHANTLFLDFYLPLLKLCIEVNGEQHYNFSAFFHGSRLNFMKHKRRDREKRDWCDINSIKVIELPYNENTEQWRDRLLNHE